MAHWRPTAYILILEHRICTTCRRRYTAPAHSTRVQLTLSNGNARRTISIEEFAERMGAHNAHSFSLPTLPRRIEDVHTLIPACPSCFHHNPETQTDFWPTAIPVVMTVASIEASRKRDMGAKSARKIIPATADDI